MHYRTPDIPVDYRAKEWILTDALRAWRTASRNLGVTWGASFR